jgi:hypothetical protein
MVKLFFTFLIFSNIAVSAQATLASDVFDPTEVNKTLLEDCIVQELNKRKKIALEDNSALKNVAYQFQESFQSRHFYSAKRYQARIDKEIRIKGNEKLKYNGTLIVSAISSVDAINYNGKKFHYHRGDTWSKLHLFYGERTKLNQIEENLIPLHTYESMAESIVDDNLAGFNKKMMKSSAYKDIGVSVSLDYKTLYRSKIPQIKVIIILGGSQTALLQDLTN